MLSNPGQKLAVFRFKIAFVLLSWLKIRHFANSQWQTRLISHYQSPAKMIRTPDHLKSAPFLIAMAIIAFLGTRSFACQITETFDGAEPSWFTIGERADCQLEPDSWKQDRVVNSKTKIGSEQFRFTPISGKTLMIGHNVAPSFMIPELKASVRIRSLRRGVQLHARIVLPHNELPDGQPMTVVLDGPVSKQQGRYETLSFSGERNLSKLLKNQLWLLRSRYKQEVTLRDAYLDQIWLNIYTGKGESIVQVDSMEVNGVVDASAIANERQLADNSTETINTSSADGSVVQQASTAAGKSLVERDGTVILVNKKPFFPKIIEHNGESFEYLKAIGFNTIALKSNATAVELAEAKKLGLWLIASPPVSVGVEPIGLEYDSVLAWSVGRELSAKHASRIRQRIREIRETDTRTGRPIFGHSASHWSQIAQQVDIHSIGLQPVGSSYLLSQYSDWLKARSLAIGSSKPICADVQTEMSEAVLNQTSAIFGQAPPTPIEYQQLKTIATEAIVAGARCLRFRSRSRLDSDDPESRLRSLTIEYVNGWLDQVEPWISGGIVLGQLPGSSTNGEEVEITALTTDRARLLLVQRPTHHEQFWAGDRPAMPLTLVDSDTIHTHRVYQLTDSELAPLSTQRTPEGTEIRIEKSPFMVTLVMTQDSNLISKLDDSFGGNGTQSMFDMHLSITQQWLAIEQLLSGQMEKLGKNTSGSSGAINEAVTALQSARQLGQQSSFSQAEPFLTKADERLAFFRRELQATALGTFQSKTSSPLTMHAALVPLHWVLSSQTPQASSSINHLAGGDFENLAHMKTSGWANQRIEDQRLRTQVELTADAAKGGKSGLKLTTSGNLQMVETVPLWVSSPPVRVKNRQLVRIHGWINVPNVISGSEAGLRIVDSIGGKDLAETIPRTQGWQEFTLYRSAAEDMQLSVDFELTGIGQAMIDEVTVQVIDLPSPERSAQR